MNAARNSKDARRLEQNRVNARHLAPGVRRYANPIAAAMALAALLASPALAEPAAAEPEAESPLMLAGQMQTSLSASLGEGYAGAGGEASFGAEQYSNLRLDAPLGGRGKVYAAVNLVAAAGSSVPASVATAARNEADTGAFAVGEGYAAALELERLYYRIEGAALDLEAGLMRLPFGFGQAWSPSDFLASRNPLLPDARPRGRLVAALTSYPAGDWKLKAFALMPRDALEPKGEGAIAGATAERHGRGASAQALYALEADAKGIGYATHRFGLSVKAEAGAGIVLDALYTLDRDWIESGEYYGRDWSFFRGLEASLGADYSLFGGDLYVLAQYLYRGGSALDPGDGLERLYGGDSHWSDKAPEARGATMTIVPILGELNRRDYLYAALTWRFDDYDAATLSCVACLDDASFVPSLSMEREQFQGLTLSLDCRVPLDARVFSSGADYGELGPTNSGARAAITAKAKLKF
jgi:hypothetical protein